MNQVGDICKLVYLSFWRFFAMFGIFYNDCLVIFQWVWPLILLEVVLKGSVNSRFFKCFCKNLYCIKEVNQSVKESCKSLKKIIEVTINFLFYDTSLKIFPLKVIW